MITKIKRLNVLVNKLDMELEMQPLLESNSNEENGYEKFERAVNEILIEYIGKKPLIKKKVKGYKKQGTNPIGVSDRYFSKTNWYNKAGFIKTEVESYYPITNSHKCIDYFKRNYCINQEFETLKEIAEKEGILLETATQMSRSVVKLLKQKHKKDLWYRSL
jgi:hypothetical protein